MAYITAGTDRYGPLPMFPAFHDKPSEERIERAVERLTDVADAGRQGDAGTVRRVDGGAQQMGRRLHRRGPLQPIREVTP